jgi:hypothetical protein
MTSLVQRLNDELRNEGYTFAVDERAKLENGFFRVNVSKGGGLSLGEYNLYLDLRLGLLSPRGQVIEMASSTMANFGMPGFARHIPAQNQISSTVDTFKDYVRSIYDFALAEGKQPREVAWTVYQKGYEPRNYPASETVGIESYETPMTPAAGGVITRSSSSGQRALMASTVRWVVPFGTEPKDYVNKTMERGNAAEPLGMPGYGPNLKMSGWTPMGTQMYTARPQFAGGEQTFVKLPRGLVGSFKSMTSTFGARNLADVPLVRDPSTGRYIKVKPSQATQGAGYRTGWTQSTMVLPTETEPRTVFSASVGMIDQPDMPGAMFQSKGAFDFFDQSISNKGIVQKQRTAAIGESGDITYEFGVKTAEELGKIVQSGLEFLDIEGKQMRPGRGMQTIARYQPEGADKYKNLFIEKRSYPVVLHKPTLHIPQYYEVTPGGEMFSNLPVYDQEGTTLLTTDNIISDLKAKYGDNVNIVQYSAIGSRGEANPAAVYLTIPMERVNPVGAKSDAFKAYPAPKDYQFKLRYLGSEEHETPVDFVTQEGKIPPRAIMQSVGIMNKEAAVEFMGLFLPQGNDLETQAVKKIQEYIGEQFTKPKVTLESRSMATIWNQITGQTLSPDELFGRMGERIGAITDSVQAVDMANKFGLRIPVKQMAFGGVYSESSMNQLKEIFGEFGPEAQSLLRFEPYKAPGKDTAMAEALKGSISADLYSMYYQVPGGAAKNITLQTGLSFVSEYTSQSGYVNAKGIMSLIQNYPKIAFAMGLADRQGNWKGVFSSKAYSEGQPEPSVAAAQVLKPYLEFQQKLFNSDNVNFSLPAKHIALDADMAADMLSIIGSAKQQPTDQAQLEALKHDLGELNPKVYGLEKRTSFTDSFFYDPNTGTIAPSVESIIGTETYEKGVQEGQTVKYLGKNYMNLLESMARSAMSEPGAMQNVVGPVRESFFRKINKMVYPGGRRSKEFARNIVGMNLPGTRGGRYQGMTELESGNAYASDEYIIRMLSNGGFMKAGQISSILRYLNGKPEAYLPILSQRFPDVGGETMFMPLKLRSAKHLKALGVPIPEGPTANDLMFMSTNVNRFQVGDFDADPAKQKVLPMNRLFDPKSKQWTDEWYMSGDLTGEFESKFKEYYGTSAAIGQKMEELFGIHGTSAGGNLGKSSESLDVARKNAADYITAVLGESTSYQSRMRESGGFLAKDAQEQQMNVMHMKSGMGLSYIMRTELTDIASAVLGMSGRDTGIFKRAYESSGLTYQMYLDRWQNMKGGFTAVETLMNTYGIYGIDEAQGVSNYRVSYKLTEQGLPVDVDRKNWSTGGGAGMEASSGLLRQLLHVVGNMPKDIMTDEMLAWLVSGTGGAGKVLTALKNPADFWKAGGMESTWSKEAIGNRANIVKEMTKTGEVGFNSPLYMGLTYKAIQRAARDFPGYIQNRDIVLPWLDGKMMPVSDIMQTPEYRLWGVAENMFVRGSKAIDPKDMQLLENIGGPRLAGEMAGIYSSWKQATGGIYPVEQAELEYGARQKKAYQIFGETAIKNTPVVHASELGALLGLPNQLRAQGWLETGGPEKIEAQYHAVLSALGAPQLMSSRDYPGTQFLTTAKIMAGESIIGGTEYEAAYARSHPGLTHVGSVDPNASLKYRLGGLEIRGVPDFISLENGKFVIRDTKSPAEREGIQYTAGFAETMAKKYRYRIQQMAYAYGLEKMAKDTGFSDPQWISFMKNWHLDNPDTALTMRQAAAAGNFKLLIAPGRYVSGLTPDVFKEIEVPYGNTEKLELETLAASAKEQLFQPKVVGRVASNIYTALAKGTTLTDLPSYTRSGQPVDMEMYDLFRKTAEQTGFPIEGARMSGGGRIDSKLNRIVRVGEGGPEDIILSNNEVTVVPTSDIPNRTMSQYRQGGGLAYSDEIYRRKKAERELRKLQQQMGVPIATGNEDLGLLGRLVPSETATEPVIPAPVQPGTNIISEEYLSRLEAISGTFGTSASTLQAIQEGGGMTMRIQGKANPPNQEKIARQIEAGLTQFTGRGFIEKFQTEVSNRMIGLFKQQGKYEQFVEGKGYEGAINANKLINLAYQAEIPEEEILGTFADKQFQARASRVFRGGKGIESLLGMVQKTPGGIGGLLATQGLNPLMQTTLEHLQSYMGDTGETERAKIREATEAAQYITGNKAGVTDIRKSPLYGVSEDTIKAYNDSMRNLTSKQLELARTTEGTKDHHIAYQKAIEAGRVATTTAAEASIERHKALSGLYTRKGELMTEAQMTRAGIEPTSEQIGEIGQVKLAQGAYARALREEGRPVPTVEGGPATRLGAMSRRLLGGFGLMYLRSIGGLMTTGAYTGLNERMAYEQQMGQQFLGVGGQMPVTPMEEQQRILATQYGGSGGLMMQTTRNMIMAQQQPAYQLATTGLAGISAGGMAMWLGEGLGWSEAKAGRAGLVIGGITMAANTALNIAGAAQDVQGTSMNLAIRRARGENFAGTAAVSGITGLATGAALGAAIGNVPGAIIGGIAGGALGLASNYQNIAAIFNPEIGKQAELLTAIAGRGTTPISEVIQQYGIAPDQTAYYARLAAEIEGAQKKNLGITPEAWGAASAFELRQNISLGDQARRQFAQMTQAGFNPEAFAVAATQALGMPITQARGVTGSWMGGPALGLTRPTVSTTGPTTAQQAFVANQIATGGIAGVGPQILNNMVQNQTAQANWAEATISGYRLPQPTQQNITLSPEQIAQFKQNAATYTALGSTQPTNIAATNPELASRLAGTGNVAPIMQFVKTIQDWTATMAASGVTEDVSKERLTAAWQALGAFGAMGAAGARQAMGPVGAGGITSGQFQKLVDYSEKLAAMQATGWAQTYQSKEQLRATQLALGMTPIAAPNLEDYANRIADPIKQMAEQIQDQLNEIPANMKLQAQKQATAAFGFIPTMAATTPMGFNQYTSQVQAGQALGQQFMMGGLNEQAASQLGGAFAAMPAQVYGRYQGLFSGNALQMAGFAMERPNTIMNLMRLGGTSITGQPLGAGMLPGIGGSTLNMANLGLTGIGVNPITGMVAPTGQGYGETTYARPFEVAALTAGGMAPGAAMQQSAANVINGWFNSATATAANRQFNANGVAWQNNPNFSQGYIGALLTGGQQGGQAYQQAQSAQYQLAQAGIGIAQLQLQAQYQPQFWALEDRTRQLGYRQQEWGFQQQGQQLALGEQNFQFQTGMQQRQMTMQRGWQQQDWAYQAQTRGLQWQWQTEDFQENVRFMTGRERRLAERQMGRATTLHDLEGEQIDKQKDRQKQLWMMEDERFNQQVGYQEELFKMQEDNLNKQKEFFEERKTLEQEQVDLNREYWQKQHDLSMSAAGAASKYATEQVGIANAMLVASQNQQAMIGEGGLFNSDTWKSLGIDLATVDPLFASYVENIGVLQPLFADFVVSVKELISTLGGTPWNAPATGAGGGANDPTVQCPLCNQSMPASQLNDHMATVHHRATGGRTLPGIDYIIGERGIEVFRPDSAGTVKPLDPWGTTFTSNTSSGADGKPGTVHLVVYLGDERLIDRVLEQVDQEIRV